MSKKEPQIICMPGIVYLKAEKVMAGALDTSSKKSAEEYCEVLGVGEGVEGVKVGDMVFAKISWASDPIYHQDKQYVFVNVATKGILAVVK
jgi:co-chaperonin GroES (HSP10)